MIEQGIYFALGCIVTALLSLLFAPVFWRRALRLTRQRLSLQVPLSMQEILAQRDQIRAEFAVERLRLEQDMEALQATKAADMAEIGRHSVVATKLGEEVAALRQTEQSQQADIDRLRRELADASVTSPSEVEQPETSQKSDDAAADREKLRSECDSLRASVAALTTRGMGLEARLKDAERGAASKDTEAALRARLETASEHIARHEAAGSSMRRELDDAKTHIRKLERELELAGLALSGGTDRKGRDGNGAAETATDDDAGLRETIHALGLAVAKLTRQAQDTRASRGEMPRLPSVETSTHPLGVG